MKPDFSGYATKADLECADGAVIKPNAFKHQDGQKVPLVWQHQHNNPKNVLGHAILSNRPDGTYAECFLNSTDSADHTRQLLTHGDVGSLSIYANNLVRRGVDVLHGSIKEVSVVLSGANPGALIDTINLAHSEDGEEEAIIYTGISIQHAEEEKDNQTVQDVYNALTDEQKDVVSYLVGQALDEESSEEEENEESDDNVEHDNLGGETMARNVFEQTDQETPKAALTPDQLKTIVHDAMKTGSLKQSFLAHAETYGITNIEVLFPDAKTLTNTPEFIGRETSWVAGVINGAKKTPFSRIKTILADITEKEARAKGYITGTLKKEEVFSLLKRTTGPTTIYKKQKLDRDDVIDITDLDVVAWLKAEMRLMHDEELARAILIGDGREASDEDKIKDPQGSVDGLGIRSILNENELYATKIDVTGTDEDPTAFIDAVLRARKSWKGSGTPTLYTTTDVVVDLLLSKDTLGRRYYRDESELASALRVGSIVEVEAMEEETDLLGILVNMGDYSLGTDKGGQISFFDDFDIDYNQYKYLLETRVSGALTKPKSALVLKKA